MSEFLVIRKCSWFEAFLGTKIATGVLETWTFPDGVLGHTEIIIITLGAYIPRVLFNGHAQFIEDCLHPLFSTISKLFRGSDIFAA